MMSVGVFAFWMYSFGDHLRNGSALAGSAAYRHGSAAWPPPLSPLFVIPEGDLRCFSPSATPSPGAPPKLRLGGFVPLIPPPLLPSSRPERAARSGGTPA